MGTLDELLWLPEPPPQKRPRDSQRSRLYSAERVLSNRDEHGQPCGSVDWTTVAEVQAFVDRVTRSRWWKSRSRVGKIVVKDGRGGMSARAYRSRGQSVIAIPRWARTRRVVLHELSHHLTPWTAAAHGNLFAANLVDLVRRWMGPDEAEALKESFRQAKVRHRR